MKQTWTTDYDSVVSKWIDAIGRSDKQWANKVVAMVHYTNQQGYTNGDLYYWVSEAKYYRLVNAESQGSEFYHNWSVYGKPAERYNYQDMINEDKSVSGNSDNESIEESISGDELRGIRNASQSEEYKDLLNNKEAYKRYMEDSGSEVSFDDAKKWIDRLEGFEELLDRGTILRENLKYGNLTKKKMFKQILLDVQEMFGISLDKRFMFSIINQIDVGPLSPQKFMSYKYKVKQIYDALEKDGLKGMSQVGQRYMSSKNPLIRNRYAYKGKEVVKGALKNKKWLEGEDMIKAIKKHHSQVLKESAQGFKRQNSQYLVKKTTKGITKVRWKKDVTIGRKIITTGKKILRIAKFFI